MTYFKIFTVFLFFVGKASLANFKCADANVEPCKCYTVPTDSSELVCDNVDLTDAKLKEIGIKISGDVYLLHLTNVKTLTKILADTFKSANFKKIFIENNPTLTTIEPKAFADSANTEILAIRNNPSFKVGVSETVKAFASGLVDIEFQKNAIVDLAAKAFADLPKAVYIRMDEQSGEITLGDTVFSNLPALKQMSLNTNKFKAVGSNAIDLSASNANVAIFLQNIKSLETLKNLILPANFKLPSTGTVHLDLENSLLVDFPEICYKIASIADGICYLGQNALTTCECAKWVSEKTKAENVWGLPTGLKCGTVAIKECV